MTNCKHNIRFQILLIDDEQTLLKVTAEALKSMGYDVWTAQDCETGLAIWKSNHIDIVMCDFELPDNCGLEVGEYIKNHCEFSGVEKTAFVLVTGWADTLTNDIAVEQAGVDEIIAKPVDLETLQAIILRFCGPKENSTFLHRTGNKKRVTPLIS